MVPVLKWQYDQLFKELILLQKYQLEKSSSDENGIDMILRRYLMTIEAYTQEIIALETNKNLLNMLTKLTIEAKRKRDKEEIQTDGEKTNRNDLRKWAKTWLDELESNSLSFGKILKPGLKNF